VGTATFPEQLLQVCASLIVAAAVYLGMAVLLKSEEMRALRRLIGRFLRRPQSDIEPRGMEPVEEDTIIESD